MSNVVERTGFLTFNSYGGPEGPTEDFEVCLVLGLVTAADSFVPTTCLLACASLLDPDSPRPLKALSLTTNIHTG